MKAKMKKEKASKKLKEYCHACQIKRGGKVPRGGHDGITVYGGVCDGCNEPGTLVPSCDYDWPKIRVGNPHTKQPAESPEAYHRRYELRVQEYRRAREAYILKMGKRKVAA